MRHRKIAVLVFRILRVLAGVALAAAAATVLTKDRNNDVFYVSEPCGSAIYRGFGRCDTDRTTRFIDLPEEAGLLVPTGHH